MSCELSGISKVAGYERGRFTDITAYKNGQPVFNIEVKSGKCTIVGTVREAKDQGYTRSIQVPTYIKYVAYGKVKVFSRVGNSSKFL